MIFREWLRPPRHLVVMFFGITMVSAAALGWLSWQVVVRDRELADHQAQQGRETAGRLTVAALQKNLSELEERLTALANLPKSDLQGAIATDFRSLSEDSVLVMMDNQGVLAYPTDRLLHYPAVGQPYRSPSVFAEADALEVRRKDYPRAIEALQQLLRSPDSLIRAEALLRQGRNLRLSGRSGEAAGIYQQLAQLENVLVPPGLPADFVARTALITLFESTDKPRAKHEALTLYRDLHAGRWQLPRAAYDSQVESIRRILGSGVPKEIPSRQATSLTEAVGQLWEETQSRKSTHGRQTFWSDAGSLLLVKRTAGDRTVALVAGPSYIESQWLDEVRGSIDDYGIALTDAAAHPVTGTLGGKADAQPLHPAAETGLPWDIHAMSSENPQSEHALNSRTELVIAGVGAIALLVVGGSYLIGRAVSRELAVARLQSDFVSAVSHEFRTPLTALRQLSELLVQDRVPNDEVRHQYYRMLEQESGRLHRLVEGLLKFGRLEANAAKYEFGSIDTNVLVASIVKEFSPEAHRRGFQIEVRTDETIPPAFADREALGCVVWNLLDNAVKYSPDSHTVWIDLARDNAYVAIRVRDKGIGIPREDRERIFQKFVRGDAARSLAIPGTGIGLAISRQIVLKHGGDIRLESEPGSGSTFTVLLPVADT